MSPRRISSKIDPFGSANRGCVMPTHGSYLSSGRGRSANCPTSTRSSSPCTVNVSRSPMSRPSLEARSIARRRGARDLEPDDLAEAAPLQLELDRLEQVVGLVRHLEVGVARDAERRALDDLHLREEHAAGNGGSRSRAGGGRRACRRAGTAAGARAPSRARSAPRPSSGSRTKRPRLSERPEMYGNGWPGPDGERRQHRKDLALETARQLLELAPARSPRRCATTMPSAASAGLELALPQLRLPRRQVEHALADLGERLATAVRPSGERAPTPGVLLPAEAGDPHHEELVEVRARRSSRSGRARAAARSGRRRARGRARRSRATTARG